MVVDGDGVLTTATPFFESDDRLGDTPAVIVAVLGVRGCGKSTLVNALFDATVPVGTGSVLAQRRSPPATTGILAAKDESPLAGGSPSPMLVLDVGELESESRPPTRADRAFHARSAAFAAGVADVILLNVWAADVGRLDGAAMKLLEAVFAEVAKTAAEVSGDENRHIRTGLTFVVRDAATDVDISALGHSLVTDAADVWAGMEVGDAGAIELEDYFDFEVVALPHYAHARAQWDAAVADLSKRLRLSVGGEDTSALPDDTLLLKAYNKGIATAGLAAYSRSLWEATKYAAGVVVGTASSVGASARSARATSSLGATAVDEDGQTDEEGADGGGGAGSELAAVYHCDSTFSEVLNSSSREMSAVSRTQTDDESPVENLGTALDEIMNTAMEVYDEATGDYAETAVQGRKRRELEAILDTMGHAVFVRQLALLREASFDQFKTATGAGDGAASSEVAFFEADASFVAGAEAAKRTGSGWSYESMRADLQSLMQELSAQRKKVVSTKIAASAAQSHAMQYLQMQLSQLQAMQQQQYSGGSGGQWNVGAAYRPPDTNINLSLGHQQGRTNVQVSMVPDEAASCTLFSSLARTLLLVCLWLAVSCCNGALPCHLVPAAVAILLAHWLPDSFVVQLLTCALPGCFLFALVPPSLRLIACSLHMACVTRVLPQIWVRMASHRWAPATWACRLTSTCNSIAAFAAPVAGALESTLGGCRKKGQPSFSLWWRQRLFVEPCGCV